MQEPIHILGGGLAGSEAAWQAARRGARVVLHEMRPAKRTAAHQTGGLAELVCSNSLKSEQESTAPWLLKQELRRFDSLLLRAAEKARVPGRTRAHRGSRAVFRGGDGGHRRRAGHRAAPRGGHRAFRATASWWSPRAR